MKRQRSTLQILRTDRHNHAGGCVSHSRAFVPIPRRHLYRKARRLLFRSLSAAWNGSRVSLRQAIARLLRGVARGTLIRILRNPSLAAAAVALMIAPTASAQNVPIDLSDVAAGNGGFAIYGIDAGDLAGFSVSGAGDVNGDGLDDVIIGAYYAAPDGRVNAGESYVVWGKTTGSAVNLSNVAAGIGGFIINGIDISDYSGRSVSGAGDVNGDGRDDIIVGAYTADPAAKSEAGESYVIFGKANGTAVNLSSIVSGTGGFVINGIDVVDFSGTSVSGAGDVNGDGLDDLIVGARQGDPANQVSAGESYVVFGKTNTTAVELVDVATGTGGFIINGIDEFDRSGWSVSGAGDVNGDGMADLIVGAPYADPGGRSRAGESYVVFGKSDGTAVNLSDVASGSGGFIINGDTGSDQSGASVSGAGDVNGDGKDDVIVGAWLADPAGDTSAGESYVIFGKTTGTAVNVSSIASGAGGGFVINGIDSQDASGDSVSGAGDVNGDGLDDVIIGAFGGTPAGEAYVVFGKTTSTAVQLSNVAAGNGGFIINGVASNDFAGNDVSGAGDVNGDGAPDLLVGATGLNDFAGGAYVVFSTFPGNTRWVDFAHGGTENGLFNTPFNTFSEAVASVPSGGTIKLKGNSADTSSTETSTISKPMTIEAVLGAVTIGAAP